MAKRFLDDTGVTHLWGKIKGMFATKAEVNSKLKTYYQHNIYISSDDQTFIIVLQVISSYPKFNIDGFSDYLMDVEVGGSKTNLIRGIYYEYETQSSWLITSFTNVSPDGFRVSVLDSLNNAENATYDIDYLLVSFEDVVSIL